MFDVHDTNSMLKDFHILRISLPIFQYILQDSCLQVYRLPWAQIVIKSFLSCIVFSMWNGKTYFVETTVVLTVACVCEIERRRATKQWFSRYNQFCRQCVKLKLTSLVKANVKRIMLLNWQIRWFTLSED